ncbi:HAD-IA family hydrolase [Psychromarinibacter halotolerans]|uniref:HAD-IA family hydrolase n=1 Tax=Psychromarinibacter halotolerans TaxID=1775175 RepID=A0ABV7GZA2_9RHOB|nr:HAD-IA family hydrolase [Psychromarinibacter halotolerans]MDF0596344.1 HAD-IA family hydrolase [Psychromarinibacter halotolerans]
MTDRLKLVIFDVDGTLVEGESHIVDAMQQAFAAHDLSRPASADVRAVIGLSVETAVARLSPDLDPATCAAVGRSYRTAFRDIRLSMGAARMNPLFPGIREVLDELAADPWTLLAVATGKSRRGLDALIEGHGLTGLFISTQTADDHPSKPDPSMIAACLADAGAEARDAVMIGDTSYDMEMARAAGVRSIGVTWGAHAADRLAADALAHRVEDLPGAIGSLLGEPA